MPETDKPLIIEGWRVGDLKPKQVLMSNNIDKETERMEFEGIENYEFGYKFGGEE